jgi:hypothetical protein
VNRVPSIAALFFALFTSLMLRAQIVPANPPSHTPIAIQAVTYLYPVQVKLPAGKPTAVVLHFRIAPGLHINSHTPLSNFLIPTALSFSGGAGVRLNAAAYPDGTEITLPIDPTTKLSVYTGEFAIQTRLVADPGDHPIQVKLHYQACNNDECLPPKTLTVAIDVQAQ